jgi:hypothetical protein
MCVAVAVQPTSVALKDTKSGQMLTVPASAFTSFVEDDFGWGDPKKK